MSSIFFWTFRKDIPIRDDHNFCSLVFIGTISRELRWELLPVYINWKLFSRADVAQHTVLVVLKGHFAIYKRRSSICTAEPYICILGLLVIGLWGVPLIKLNFIIGGKSPWKELFIDIYCNAHLNSLETVPLKTLKNYDRLLTGSDKLEKF